jgi:hypothetical protein
MKFVKLALVARQTIFRGLKSLGLEGDHRWIWNALNLRAAAPKLQDEQDRRTNSRNEDPETQNRLPAGRKMMQSVSQSLQLLQLK